MRPVMFFVAISLLVLPGRTSRAQTPPPDTTRQAWTTVTWLAGASVYIDVGTRAGLAVGSRADVIRGGRTIAELEVEFVSSTRAACRIVTSTASPAVGDSVRFRAAATRPVDAAAPVSPAAPGSRPRAAGRRAGVLHGRIGSRYFVTRFSTTPAQSTTQPAFDARVDGQSLGGSPVGVSLDVRAYRTRQSSATSADVSGAGNTRVYQAAIHLDGTAGPGRITIGRQFATTLSPVGLFDGISADYTWTHTGAGLFAGNQPDAVDFRVSSDVREYGAWFRLHSAPGGRGVWSLTTGAIGSYAHGTVNREFLYLQGQYVNPAVSLFAAQEVDYNRNWRADAESTTTTPTSSLITARVALGPVVSLNAGYDNRRSVRLYRDFASPEIEFDDSFRQGAWAGVQFTANAHFRGSFDARSSRGGSGGSSDSWTASAGVTSLTPLGLGARARVTRYRGALLEGTLRSASIDLQPGGRFRLDLAAGTREDLRSLGGTVPSSTRWIGVDFDTGLGRSFFLTLSMYRESGADEGMLQHFAALSYRF